MYKKCTGYLSCPTQIPFSRSLHTLCCECRLFMAHNNLLLWRTTFRRTEAISPRLHHGAPPPSNRQWPMTDSGGQKVGCQKGLNSVVQSVHHRFPWTRLQANFSQNHILTEFYSPALPGFLHSPSSNTISVCHLQRNL